MPQMKPMNWIILFMILNMITMMMNINIYFNNNNKMLIYIKKYNMTTKKNWKW